MKLKVTSPISLFWGLVGLVYFALLATISYLAYTHNLPNYFGQIPFYDTIGHFGLYAIATYIGHRVLKGRKTQLLGYRVSVWGLWFTGITILDEVLQSLSPYRTFSLLDLTASLIGVYAGYFLAERSLAKLHPSPTSKS